jgi:HK97 family phage major capsid protein
MRAIELREKRAQAWEAAKAFAESHRGANDLLSPEDGAVFDKMEAEVVAMGREIDRLERGALLEQEVAGPMNGIPVSIPGSSPGNTADAYRTAFWNALRGRGVTNSLHESADPAGGYLAPDQFERQLIEALDAKNIMRQICHKIPVSSRNTLLPIVADKGTAAWSAEEAEILESDDTFGQITLGAHKLTSLIKASSELLQDSAFPLESYIAKEFARRIAVKEEEAFLVGTGTNQPTGILTDAQQGKVAASATAITFDEVIDLFYSLKAAYRSEAIFLANDATLGALRKLKDSSGQYLWVPSVQEGQPDRILGRPIYTSPFMPAMAAGAKALLVADFNYYWIADRSGRSIKRLDQLFAVTDQVGFLTTERVDGKLVLAESAKYLTMAAA